MRKRIKVAVIIIFIIMLPLPFLGQSISISKNTLQYLKTPGSTIYYDLDSIMVYNTGGNILSLDSMNNINIMYSYYLTFSYAGELQESYVGYYSEMFPQENRFPFEIPPNDSAKLIFQYIGPITKISTFDDLQTDSIFIYNNSINLPNAVLYVVNDIPFSIDNPGGVPLKYSLSQNYPNPFNPATTITYNLPETAHVLLVVYDSLGRIIKTLVNSTIRAGNHEVIFNGKGLVSGVYYYQLIAGEYRYTKKMVMLK